jgi:hypothetical protein
VIEAPGATALGRPKPCGVAQPLPMASLLVPNTTESQTGFAPLLFHDWLPVLVSVMS